MFNLPNKNEFFEILVCHTSDWTEFSKKDYSLNRIVHEFAGAKFSHAEIIECLTAIRNEQNVEDPAVYDIIRLYFIRLLAMKNGRSEEIPLSASSKSILLYKRKTTKLSNKQII